MRPTRTTRTTARALPQLSLLIAAVFALVAAFFIAAPPAWACPTQLTFVKVETGAGAPADPGTYTIRISGPNQYQHDVQVKGDGKPVTVDLPGVGLYSYTELDSHGAGVTFDPVGPVKVEMYTNIRVIVTNHFPAGKLAIHKVETGNLAPAASYTFDVDGPGANDFQAVVAAGQTWTSGWLPLGSYAISEVGAPLGATVSPNPALLTADGATVTVTATNPYPAGKLAIHKVETGSLAPAASYTFDVDGPGANDFQAVVAAGQTWTSGWLPLGSYAISEVGAPLGATVSPNPAQLTADGATVTVLATNPFPAGKLAIHKVETGNVVAGGTYAFAVDGPGANDFQASVTAGETWTSGWLPLGSYLVTELDAPAGATLSPNPAELTADGVTVEVTATNPIPSGKLAITKVETGSAAPGATYTFAVDGPGANDFQASVTAGETWTSGWLPLGSYLVTESDAPAGATLSPNPAELTADGVTVEVTATNPYPAGKLAIAKVETGNLAPDASYVFEVDGPGANDFQASVSAGETWTSGWLPLGSYLVTESDAPAGATLSPNPAELTADGVTVLVTATNPFGDSTTTTTTSVAPAQVQGATVAAAAVTTTTATTGTLPYTGTDLRLAWAGLALVLSGAFLTTSALLVRRRQAEAS